MTVRIQVTGATASVTIEVGAALGPDELRQLLADELVPLLELEIAEVSRREEAILQEATKEDEVSCPTTKGPRD
jgi:hypothetical protein